MCTYADGKDVTPGPLDYSPDPAAVLPSAPCYTIAGRTAAADAAVAASCSNPGPGDYEAAALQGSKWQGPAWTMVGRAADAGDCGSDGPGVWCLCDLLLVRVDRQYNGLCVEQCCSMTRSWQPPEFKALKVHTCACKRFKRQRQHGEKPILDCGPPCRSR